MKITIPCAHKLFCDDTCGAPVTFDLSGDPFRCQHSAECAECGGTLLIDSMEASAEAGIERLVIVLGDPPRWPGDPEFEDEDSEPAAPVYHLDAESGRIVDHDRPGEDVTREALEAGGWQDGDTFVMEAQRRLRATSYSFEAQVAVSPGERVAEQVAGILRGHELLSQMTDGRIHACPRDGSERIAFEVVSGKLRRVERSGPT